MTTETAARARSNDKSRRSEGDSDGASFEARLHQLQDDYLRIRERMVRLCEPLEIEDYVVQAAAYVSPPKWHLGHTSWFFDMLLKAFKAGHQPLSMDFAYYLNSYYEGFGKRIEKSKRGTQSRPTVKATLDYRRAIDDLVSSFLGGLSSHPKREHVLKQFRIGLEHESQHQELLVYDLKHMLGEKYRPQVRNHLDPQAPVKADFVEFPEGVYEVGAAEDDGFPADNECPKHKVYVQPFALANKLVTTADYLEFIEDGGYQNYQWWLSDGWAWVQKHNIKAPFYFVRQGNTWLVRDFSSELGPDSGRQDGFHPNYGENELQAKENPKVEPQHVPRGTFRLGQLRRPLLEEPISHVSYYEASAYAKWKGCRLPTEMEWEVAATAKFGGSTRAKTPFPWEGTAITQSNANFMENYLWGPSVAGSFPKGASPEGIYQLLGDLWEWTSSDYAPYPGFATHFEEYNDKWFVNQKVLRGGSWATPRQHIRSTTRNFFYPNERWMCSGFRLARTLQFG